MITQKLSCALKLFSAAYYTFGASQDLAKSFLHKAADAGKLLLEVQADFKSEEYCTANPLVVGDTSYTSFQRLISDFKHVYKQLVGDIDPDLEEFFNASTASKCMTLARRWDLACEITDLFSVKHTYRLTKTLEIIAWYKGKKEKYPDIDPRVFTCDLYWEELEAKRRDASNQDPKPTYHQLEKELEEAKLNITRLTLENQDLKDKLKAVTLY